MSLHMEGSDAIKLPSHSITATPNPSNKHTANWDEPPSLLLDESGLIRDCSKPVESLFGYRLGELVWQHISCLFPNLSEIALMEQGQINAKLDFISRCGHIFLGLNREGDTVPTELNFVRFERDGLCTLKMILRPSINPET